MQRKRASKRLVRAIPEPRLVQNPYLSQAPIIPGRGLIPGGRTGPLFPAYYRVMEREVTFGRDAAAEELILEWIRRARKGDRLVLLQVPQYGAKSLFSYGWTLVEGEGGSVLTHQCVVFLAGDPVPLCASDGGVICVALQRRLSAWNGMTDDQTLASAA